MTKQRKGAKARRLTKREIREGIAVYGLKPWYTVRVDIPGVEVHHFQVTDYRMAAAMVRGLRDHYGKVS